MIRFLHTSDWQMGIEGPPDGPKARAIREKRYDAISKLSELTHRVVFRVPAIATLPED
jgi:DNA repair exonuclease SbcCD nuclease subunit